MVSSSLDWAKRMARAPSLEDGWVLDVSYDSVTDVLESLGESPTGSTTRQRSGGAITDLHGNG